MGHRPNNSQEKAKALAMTCCAVFEKEWMQCRETRVQSCPMHEKSSGKNSVWADSLVRWILMFSICSWVLPNNSYTVLGKIMKFLWVCFYDTGITKNDFCLWSFVSFLYMKSKLCKTGLYLRWMYVQCLVWLALSLSVASRHKGITEIINWECVFI